MPALITNDTQKTFILILFAFCPRPTDLYIFWIFSPLLVAGPGTQDFFFTFSFQFLSHAQGLVNFFFIFWFLVLGPGTQNFFSEFAFGSSRLWNLKKKIRFLSQPLGLGILFQFFLLLFPGSRTCKKNVIKLFTSQFAFSTLKIYLSIW